MRTQVVRATLLTAGGLLVLLGWALLGRKAADALHGTERLSLAFADIDCTPPDGVSRADFLGEVQYLSNTPDRLPLSDDGLASRLAAAFAAHPRVESVERVEVLPRHVRVSLVFRTAVMAVAVGDWLRAVDAKGTLLPVTTATEGLPRLEGVAVVPSSATPCDERVAAAARVAAVLQPHRGSVPVEVISVEGEDVSLRAGANRFHWGRAPGRERVGEPDATTKARRLSEIVNQKGALSAGEADLARPSGGRSQ